MTYSVFVCRESELNRLAKMLNRAVKGQGQVCFVLGEAGIGKTAILKTFSRQAQAIYSDLVVAFGGCHAQTGVCDPYLPFRDILRLLTGDVQSKLAYSPVDIENTHRLRKLGAQSAQILIDVAPSLINLFVPGAALVGALGKSAAKVVGLTDKLESLADGETKSVGLESPTLEETKIFEQYTMYMQALANEHPLLIMVDDLQWADGPTISLFFHLSRCIEDSKILLVGAYRPVEVSLGRDGKRHPLESVVNELERYYGDILIDLGTTMVEEGRVFVNAYLDTEPNCFNQGFREALYQHTGGHPLFTIELLRVMQEHGYIRQNEKGYWETEPTLDWGALPTRVQGVIRERLRRLDQELLDVLSIASVEGESFIAQVIIAIKDIQERVLLRYLSQGLERGHRLVREVGEVKIRNQMLSHYKFSHLLIQKYLYNGLGSAEKRLLHGEIAAVLEKIYLGETEEIASILAHHYAEAGEPLRAVEYSLLAGRKALRLSAYQEVISILTKGLSLLNTLPVNAERNKLELELLVILGPAMMALKGHSVREVADIYTRALDLCHDCQNTQYLFPVLFRLSGIYLRQGRFRARKEVGQLLFKLARDQDCLDLLLQAYLAQGHLSYYLGALSQARKSFERVINLYNPKVHFSHAYIYGKDPCVTALNLLSQVLWYLGYPEKALETINASLRLAQKLNHPFSLGYALASAAILHSLRREEMIAQKMAEEAINLSAERGYGLWKAAGMFYHGLAHAEKGESREGIALMQKSLADWRAGGAELGVRNWPALIIEWHWKTGQTEEGLRLVNDELSSRSKSMEAVALSELYRINGELLFSQVGKETEAEELYMEAIKVSRGQGAKSLELRAVMGLSRLWLKQGKNEEAFEKLNEIYSQFTEGFETLDLKEAKLLLEEIRFLNKEVKPAY